VSIVRLSVDVDLTPAMLAESFCQLDDESQTQFFVEVAKILATWSTLHREMQTHYIANHLAGCECSSDGARWFVREIGRVIGPAEPL
jgi:hypothetical protein